MSAAASAIPVTSRGRWGRRWILIGCLAWVGLLLVLPLVAIVITVVRSGAETVLDTLRAPDVLHAFLLTAQITVITVLVTTAFGVMVAWVLVRQRFRGRSLMNAVVDLPFALSPVTVGLACVILFGPGGWFAPFFQQRGIQVIFALPSMMLVTIFICIPFTIREVVPVLEEIGLDEEDASRTLGASRLAHLLPGHAAEHPLGVGLRHRLDDRTRDRRDRRGADRQRSPPGQDRDRDAVHLSSL